MGKVEGNYFFTMEYVTVSDIARVAPHRATRSEVPDRSHRAVVHARRGALPLRARARTADGKLLDIVHRDVSPSNLLISYGRCDQLVGLRRREAATSSVKTRTGTLKGKIAYMSPEHRKARRSIAAVTCSRSASCCGDAHYEAAVQGRERPRNDPADHQLATAAADELRPRVSAGARALVLEGTVGRSRLRAPETRELQVELEELRASTS